MARRNISDWPPEEVKWKFDYLGLHLSSPFLRFNPFSQESMAQSIAAHLEWLPAEKKAEVRNRMNNAWRQHKKRAIDEAAKKIQRSFTMDCDTYEKLREMAVEKRIPMNRIIGDLIDAAHEKMKKKKATQIKSKPYTWGTNWGAKMRHIQKSPDKSGL